jgi:hypothetical protein
MFRASLSEILLFRNVVRNHGYTESNDGVIWDAPIPITQDGAFPILTGAGFFYQLYGPGFVIYNPKATSTPGQPYSFPYVMFYDVAQIDQSGKQTENIGLAFSSDGKFWTGFYSSSNQPIFLAGDNSSDWDFTHVFRPSILKIKGVYHMFYSGSNALVDQATTVVYAHGIGHASSIDGINWLRDQGNPIFIYSNDVLWRNTRTYTPFVLGCGYCGAKMWFTGGTTTSPNPPVAGVDGAIGFATLECP